MAKVNLDELRNKLNSLSGKGSATNPFYKKKDLLWRPPEGKSQVRIVPYMGGKDFPYIGTPGLPFMELYFHYGFNNKNYVSPASFGESDPILSFAEKLGRGGKEDWTLSNTIKPKLRTYVPVIVRGEEEKGIQFWGFGKTLYKELLEYVADPDFGDITDLTSGRDITIQFAKETKAAYPTPTIMIRPNVTPAGDAKLMAYLQDTERHPRITDLYNVYGHDILKEELERWLSNADLNEDDRQTSHSASVLQTKGPVEKPKLGYDEEEEEEDDSHYVRNKAPMPSPKPPSKLDDVAAAFDDLF